MQTKNNFISKRLLGVHTVRQRWQWSRVLRFSGYKPARAELVEAAAKE
jgi:hypothetical protein